MIGDMANGCMVHDKMTRSQAQLNLYRYVVVIAAEVHLEEGKPIRFAMCA
jgi:hypothetical protein